MSFNNIYHSQQFNDHLAGGSKLFSISLMNPTHDPLELIYNRVLISLCAFCYTHYGLHFMTHSQKAGCGLMFYGIISTYHIKPQQRTL